MIPYSRHNISNSDVKAVNKILRSKILARGPQIQLFEKICSIVKSKFGLAVNSATSGLHLACLSLGFKKMILFGLFQIHL